VVPGISAPIVPDDHPWKSDGTVDLPDWVLPVLNGRGLDDATVRRALSAHYEAMLLKADQPSMALLGFVASIESLAVPTKGLPRCPQCDMITGSGQRFRDALAKILSPEEIELVGKVYDHRSKTVHRGQLHASEDVLGMFPSQGFFSVDTRMLFEFGTVHLAGAASRDLLLARIAPEQSAPAEP
jgi:hypothetical protein